MVMGMFLFIYLFFLLQKQAVSSLFLYIVVLWNFAI